MKKKLSLITNISLALLIIALAAIALLKLYPALYRYDLQEIGFEQQETTKTSGSLLDNILTKHISAFSYIKSFDHVFDQGETKITLAKPLKIDRCEVSQGYFLKFVQWQKFHQPKDIKAPNQSLQWKYSSNSQKHIISGKLTAPANGITYYDAYAYCRASGGRLPYQGEWIAAATGKENRIYPWGNTFSKSAWPYLDPLLNAAQRCGAHTKTATPQQIQDMGHNVSEWATNRDDPLKPVIMGGNAYNTPPEIYSMNFLYRHAPTTYRSPYVGFRCVYDKPRAKTPWQINISTATIPAGVYSIGVPTGAKLPNMLARIPRDQIKVVEHLFQRQQQTDNNKLFLMTHEITRKQYQNFLNDPFVKLGLYADENQPKDHSYIPANWHQQIMKPKLPVINVDWWSAHAFSAWAGGRLPSAEEWIVAASNNGKYIYPWGNEFDDKIHTYPYTGNPRTAGGHAVDKTENGLFDMGGNLSEWTQSITTTDSGYSIVVKGGNYLLPAKETARIDFNNYVSPNYYSPTLGFRVAFDRLR